MDTMTVDYAASTLEDAYAYSPDGDVVTCTGCRASAQIPTGFDGDDREIVEHRPGCPVAACERFLADNAG
jgi:hypothetical protein